MRCTDCGAYFDREDAPIVKDWTGDYIVCPVCESDDIEESSKCKVCGEDIPDMEWICGDCKANVMQELSDAVGNVFGSPDYAKLESQELDLILEEFINYHF